MRTCVRVGVSGISVRVGSLARARKAAGERGITFPQLVRVALENELGVSEPAPLSSTGTVDTGGKARPSIRSRQRSWSGSLRSTSATSGPGPRISAAAEVRIVPVCALVKVEYQLRPWPGGFVGLMTDIHAGRLDVHVPDDSELARAGALVARYADLPLGLVDATVLAWVERRREPKLATLE